MRIASLRRKSNVKVRLKHIIFPKQKTKKQFFQLLHRLPNMQNPCVKQLTSYNEKKACKIELKCFTVSVSGCFYIKSPMLALDILISI